MNGIESNIMIGVLHELEEELVVQALTKMANTVIIVVTLAVFAQSGLIICEEYLPKRELSIFVHYTIC